MKFTLYLFLFIVFSLFLITDLYSQEADTLQQKISLQYVERTGEQATVLSNKLDKKAAKVLAKFQKQEAKMRSKLMKIDSSAAKDLSDNAAAKYKGLEEKLKGVGTGQYIPKLDTLVTSLKFLQSNPELLAKGKEAAAKLKDAMGKVDGLKDKFQQAEAIKQFIKERKQFLKEQLGKFGFAKELKKLNKEVYYYAQQVNEYKEILKDSKKAERKAIELLSKTKLFKDFMRKNSMLASLFRLTGDPNDPSAQVSLAGLQTRTQVNNLIQQQIAAAGPGGMQQFRDNMQAAQSQMQQLKARILKAGGGNSNDEIPDFKPNQQKTKSFLKRLEYGTNIQSQKATSFFPVTTDIGLSVGYKLNDKSIIGIGASYKMGWGRGWNNISISQQGAGLRSFVDYKLKKAFWLSGGFEMNYKSAFSSISQLKDYSAWQRSGLVGLSKVVSIKSKFLKNTKLQLLWDFLSTQQIPRTQLIIFRIGYTIK